MAKIYEMTEARKQKEMQPISFVEHLERAKDREKKSPPEKPAEVLTFEQLRRMMGDTGPRQFLKDRGNRK